MENELAQRVPRRGPVVRLTEAGAPLPRLPSSLPSLDLGCVRALPAGEPAEGRAFHARWVKETRCRSGTGWRCAGRGLPVGCRPVSCT
jgi:hypothetical protein